MYTRAAQYSAFADMDKKDVHATIKEVMKIRKLRRWFFGLELLATTLGLLSNLEYLNQFEGEITVVSFMFGVLIHIVVAVMVFLGPHLVLINTVFEGYVEAYLREEEGDV